MNLKILKSHSKLFFNLLIPKDKKNKMPSFSQAVKISMFLKKIKFSKSKRDLNNLLLILARFKKNNNIINEELKIPDFLEKQILVEYYCSKKVIKRLKNITYKKN